MVSFLLALSCFGAGLDLPRPTVETLSNGLTIAWFPSERIPVLDLAISIEVGERHDPAGKSGTANLLAAMLERGAGGKSAQEFAKALEAMGGSTSSNSNPDSMTFGIHGLSVDMPKIVELFTDSLLRPNFDPEEFRKIQARFLDSWEHIGDHGSTLGALAFQRLVAAQTPYWRGAMHSDKEFRTITLTDVKKFYADSFVPSRATLAVVGKFHKEVIRTELLRRLTMWVGPKTPLPSLAHNDARLKVAPGEIAVIHRAGLNQASVVMGFRGPILTHPDRDALLVTNSLFGEYFNSRLNSNIRDKLGLTYSIGSQWTFNRDLGIFSMSATTRNEAVGTLVKKLREALVELKRGPITSDEVQTAQRYLIGGFPVRYSTLNALAGLWLSLRPYGLSDEYLNGYAARISKLQAPEIQKAVQKHFELEKLTIVVSGDADVIVPALKKEKLKVKRFSAADLK